jgi:acyl-coenzyme A synthetase/AMP-(fatty) acid ligase
MSTSSLFRSVRNVGDLIDPAIGPEDPALIEFAGGAQQSFTYRELHEVLSWAKDHLHRFAPTRSRVAVVGDVSWRTVSISLALMASGHVVVPLNYKLSKDVLRHIAANAKINIIIYDDGYEPIAENFANLPRFHVSRFFTPIRVQPRQKMPSSASGDDWCCILYTSGSTGVPKGVPLSHTSQIWWMRTLIKQCDLHAEVVPVALPFYHMAGFFLPLLTLATHGTAILMPKFEVKQLAAALATFPCTFIATITPILARIVHAKQKLDASRLASVRLIEIGSAPLSRTLYEDIRTLFPSARVLNHYGSTEAGWFVFDEHPAGLPTPPLSLGYPLTGLEVKLIGEEPSRGVLAVRGPSVAAEYLGLENETHRRFQDGWFVTNDEMYRDERGFYYFIGRSDEMFKCNGESIYPTEIELRLEQHPAVEAVAVVPAPDAIRGQIPVAFVVRGSDQVTEVELQEFVRISGPDYQYPRVVVFVNELPVGASEKIDRQMLRGLAIKFGTPPE